MNIDHALSVRSDFSIGESMLQIDSLVSKAAELGYKSVAVTDIMTISSMVAFTGKCKGKGIKPIVGCTIRVYDDPTYRKPPKASGEKEKPNKSYWLKAYVLNETGLKNLMKLLSKGNSAENFYYHSRVGLEDVLELQGCAVTTGDFHSVFHHPDHKRIVGHLKFRGIPTFVELVPFKTPLGRTLNKKAMATASQLDLPLIASYPVLYERDDQADSLDVLRAISTNTEATSKWLPRPWLRDFHFKAPIELAKGLKDEVPAATLREALGNVEMLVGMVEYEFKKLPPCLPQMAPDEFVALVQRVKDGWNKRFSREILGHRPDAAELPVYRDRLAYELGVLKKMGFSGYFLLVQDIVVKAKSMGIFVGPGRGSVGGSLVAYLMEITDVDPIRFDLLFERFINPERLDLPDADLDFMSSRRHEVIEFITADYGSDRVAGISNYNALGAASSLRDVARISGLQPIEYSCSKQVEKEHGVSLTLEESREKVPDIEKYAARYPHLWKHSTNLEGAMRGLGRHAAGVVVAGEPLIERAVVETRTDGAVVNWDKKYVEEWGLIKMDVLGLSTLDVLARGAQYVQERHGKVIDWLGLPLNDAASLRQFGLGETSGVFQFESPGMRRLLKELAMSGSLTFDDLVAVVALYRPGPLDAGLCDDYIAIKQGAKVIFYEHPNMEPALKSTYGVIVYQEQVMQITRDLAGFTMAEADHLRKAMGKKDKVLMATFRDKFVKGCESHSGMSEGKAADLFDKIEVFAGYAFNKSHSVEYAIISFWTMWLKTHYPAEFYAASLTVADKEEKITTIVTDARKHNIHVLPPDINRSTDRIEIVGEDKLYAPFQAIKGMSDKVSGFILQARAHWGKPFADRNEFFAALEAAGIKGKVNKTHRERMDLVGAFAEAEGDKFPAMHPTRLKNRIELLTGYTVDIVKADRPLNADRLALLKVIRIAEDTRTCSKCSLSGNPHPLPVVGKTPKFMVIFDTPNYHEEKAGKMLQGDSGQLVIQALKDVGLSAHDGYFTTLVKSGKPKGVKTLTNEQINGCTEYLKQEIEVLKPPVILVMGAATARYFAPSLKGSPAELAGKVIYDGNLDASLVFGLNPAQVFFDPSKLQFLQAACSKVAELLS